MLSHDMQRLEVMRFISDGKPQSKDQTAVRLAAILEHYDRHRFGLWAVVRGGRAT